VRRVSTLCRHILRSRDGCVRRRRSVNCRDMADRTGVHLLSDGSVDGRGVLDWGLLVRVSTWRVGTSCQRTWGVGMDGGQRRDLRVPTVLGACAVVIVWRGMVRGPHARDGNGMARAGWGSTLGRHTLRSRDVCVRRWRSVNCRGSIDRIRVHLLSTGSEDGRGVLDWGLLVCPR